MADETMPENVAAQWLEQATVANTTVRDSAPTPEVPEAADAIQRLTDETAALHTARVRIENLERERDEAAAENARLQEQITSRDQARRELEETLERVTSQPGPGNSRGGLVRDVGPEVLEVRRSALNPKSKEDTVEGQKLQKRIADAFEKGEPIRYVRDTHASLVGERMSTPDAGPRYEIRRVEHPARGGIPGWVEWIQSLVRPAKAKPAS